MNSKLTLFFDGSFWTALFERIDSKYYEAAKVVFHTEPSNQEILEYILFEFNNLRFSPAISNEDAIPIRKINPKRLQRLVRKELETVGIGTKAQLALQLEHETKKLQHRSLTKVKNAEATKAKFKLHQKKKREKQKGH